MINLTRGIKELPDGAVMTCSYSEACYRLHVWFQEETDAGRMHAAIVVARIYGRDVATVKEDLERGTP